MKTNYELIRSHLEYGHKVEVTEKQITGYVKKWLLVFFNPRTDSVVDEFGGCYQPYELDEMKFESITPIPHRYKKLEEGTRVDISEDIKNCEGDRKSLAGLKNLKIYSVDDLGYRIVIGMSSFHVPHWAVTPHVEGENCIKVSRDYMKNCEFKMDVQVNPNGGKDSGDGKEIKPLEIIGEGGVRSWEYNVWLDIQNKVNELVERINLQNTNNRREMKTPKEIISHIYAQGNQTGNQESEIATAIISELEGQKVKEQEILLDVKSKEYFEGMNHEIESKNYDLDQRINEWKKLL